jgi:hypothetical protein
MPWCVLGENHALFFDGSCATPLAATDTTPPIARQS